MANDADDDLDQALTSAQAAILFALHNWLEFEADCVRQFGHCPITPAQMKAHGTQLGALIDPDRMPR